MSYEGDTFTMFTMFPGKDKKAEQLRILDQWDTFIHSTRGLNKDLDNVRTQYEMITYSVGYPTGDGEKLIKAVIYQAILIANVEAQKKFDIQLAGERKDLRLDLKYKMMDLVRELDKESMRSDKVDPAPLDKPTEAEEKEAARERWIDAEERLHLMMDRSSRQRNG